MVEKVVLLYTDPSEPVTRLLLHHKQELGIQELLVKDFLDENFKIFDRFNLEKIEVEWGVPSLGKITNSKEIYLINRATHLPEEWFFDFQLKDRDYARNELWAYLVFALNAFPNITERPNAGGLNGGCYPLTQQWKIVKERMSQALTLPDLYVGPIELLPTDWHQQAIFTHPYHFYYWKETPFDGKDRNNVFAFKKPKGKPVLASIIGDNVALCKPEEIPELQEAVQEQLKETALQISQTFKYPIAEILFFLEEAEITFGMIYNLPISTSYMPDFEARLLHWIRCEIDQFLEEPLSMLGSV